MKTPVQILKEKKEHLARSFTRNEETDFQGSYTEILDEYFRESFRSSSVGPKMHMARNPFVFLALGGYGRGEQCVHSDVDVLLLFKKRVPEEAQELVQEIFYPLWDLGLEVGHGTRTLKECGQLAVEDFEVLTSLANTRFLCGSSPLHASLQQHIQERVLHRHARSFIRWLVEENSRRHTRYGDSSYMLEPNVKEGLGGLRDYHAILWIAWAQYRIREASELVGHGHLTENEFIALREALSFIWTARNWLHHMTGRKCDQLYFEYQVELARVLGFVDTNGQQAVEVFLGTMHGHMDFLKHLHLLFLSKAMPSKTFKPIRKRPFRLRTQGLKRSGDALSFESQEAVERDPLLLIKIFELSAMHECPLSMESRRVIRDCLHLVDEEYRTSGTVIHALRRIIMASPYAAGVINEMFTTGFMAALIPETKGIVNRIQYDEYHLYPVDKHSVRTVQILKGFGEPDACQEDQLAAQLFHEISNPEILTWAALFHDIGKGHPGGDHSSQGARIAQKVFSRMGFTEEEVEKISSLVLEHLTMMKTATQRDIQEEKVVVQFARKQRNLESLEMLYLLTVADCRATGPKAWSGWIDTLLKELFFKTRHLIQKGELVTSTSARTVEDKKRTIHDKTTDLSREEVENLFDMMSPRYLLETPATDILRHMELIKRLDAEPMACSIGIVPETDYRTVTVCAKDHPGLFSRISGVFTLNNLDILNANIYTWRNGTALDIFTVTPPRDELLEDQAWDRVRRDLHAAISGDLVWEDALIKKMNASRPARTKGTVKPDKVVVNNRESDFFTIIEVYTHDFPGLLYKITHALFECGLDVLVAKIATHVDQVMDIFYVRDFEGQKGYEEGQVDFIKKTLQGVLANNNDLEE